MIATVPALRRLIVLAATAALLAGATRALPSHRTQTVAAPRSLERVDDRYEPPPPTLVVLDAGAEPRAPLRYHPREIGRAHV